MNKTLFVKASTIKHISHSALIGDDSDLHKAVKDVLNGTHCSQEVNCLMNGRETRIGKFSRHLESAYVEDYNKITKSHSLKELTLKNT